MPNDKDFFKNIAIPPATGRREILTGLAKNIVDLKRKYAHVQIIFVCTHNSRRSQASELWARTILEHFRIDDIFIQSAGVVKTQFNYRMVDAARYFGFKVELNRTERHEFYDIKSPISHSTTHRYYSKDMSDCTVTPRNAVLVANSRKALEYLKENYSDQPSFSLPYEDPTRFDHSPHEDKLYTAAFRHIGSEMLYLLQTVRRDYSWFSAKENVIG